MDVPIDAPIDLPMDAPVAYACQTQTPPTGIRAFAFPVGAPSRIVRRAKCLMVQTTMS